MLTIREDALSLGYLRTKPDEDDLMRALLDEESFAIWDNTYVPVGREMVNDAVKKASEATLTEVLALVELLDEHESAIRYDCLQMGFQLRKLGSDEFTWGELLAIVQNSPHFSALNKARNPDTWYWTPELHLQAAQLDAQNIANWLKAGGKKHHKPRPVPRPGVDSGVKKIGSKPIPLNQMAEFLGGQFLELANKNTE